VAEVYPGNAAAIHANLNGCSPAPLVIEPAAANKFAILYDRCSPEIVVQLAALVRSWESGANQDAAPGGKVGEKAVLYPLIRAAVDRSTIGKERLPACAVAKNVQAWRRRLLHERLIGCCRPHGEAIVARVAGCRVLDDRVSRIRTKVDSIGQRIAKTATIHDNVVTTIEPHAYLGVLHSDPGDRGILAACANDPIIRLSVASVVQFPDHRKIRDMDVTATYYESESPVGLAI
jgi:hypothetical protein